MSHNFRLNHPTTPLTACPHPAFEKAGIEVWIKRDDLNHPQIQGNKWHKLKLNLAYAQQQGYQQLVTFGGAYSNHIAAVAKAGAIYGWPTLGIIRGDELTNNSNAWSETLKTAALNGMQFEFVDRATYRLRQDPVWLSALAGRVPNAYILPEGGSNQLAIDGFESLVNEVQQQCDFSHLLCAVGTGGTLAGLAKYAMSNQQVWGIASLKKADYLIPQIKNWVGSDKANWRLFTDFHGGGYAKSNEKIEQQARDFEQCFGLKLDPIYTAKLVYGFNQLVMAGRFAPRSRIVLYHSGGLQGRAE